MEKPAEQPAEPAPKVRRRPMQLAVTLDGTEYSTENRGWDGTRVMLTALEQLWRDPEGRAATERTTPENSFLREQAESFGQSAKPQHVKPDGPWLSTNMSHAARAEILDAVKEELPEAMRGRLSYEVRPASENRTTDRKRDRAKCSRI